jgi:hypothetical protein
LALRKVVRRQLFGLRQMGAKKKTHNYTAEGRLAAAFCFIT